MIGIYFSGTGNTKHCVEKLVESLDKNSRVIPLESNGVIDEINNSKQIVFGYPIQYSNMPYFVREFIKKNSLLWKDKEIFIVVTMGAFSGDGSGCSARLFKKYGAKILGGLHLKMSDSVSDSKLLKKGLEGNRKIVKEADWKIENAVAMIRKGKYPSQGLSFFFFFLIY